MRTSKSVLSVSLMALVAALIVSAALVLVSPVSASAPANRPQNIPTERPPTSTSRPTDRPTERPTEQPQVQPTERPTDRPQEQPTDEPLPEPIPTARPTDKPKRDDDSDKKKDPTPTPEPSATPLPEPSAIPQTNVRIIKEVDRSSAQPSEAVVYKITVINTGSSPANDVVVRDAVPSEVEVTNLSSSKGDIVVSGQTVTAYPSTLQPGEQASYTVTGRVREGATGSVENTALVTISTPGDDPSDNSSTVIFTIPAPQPKPAAPPVIFRVPQTADPLDDALWTMLPWALLAIALIGVGGLIAWSIASQRGLTQQLLTFMSQRALNKEEGDNDSAQGDQKAVQRQIAKTIVHPPLQPFGSSDAQANTLPPLGAPFPPAPPLAPLPPPAALDRRKALQ